MRGSWLEDRTTISLVWLQHRRLVNIIHAGQADSVIIVSRKWDQASQVEHKMPQQSLMSFLCPHPSQRSHYTLYFSLRWAQMNRVVNLICYTAALPLVSESAQSPSGGLKQANHAPPDLLHFFSSYLDLTLGR